MIIDNNLYLCPPDANGDGEFFGQNKAGNSGAYSYAINQIDLNEVKNLGVGGKLYLNYVITQAVAGDSQTIFLCLENENRTGSTTINRIGFSTSSGTAGRYGSIAFHPYAMHSPLGEGRYLSLKTYRSGGAADSAGTMKLIAWISATQANMQTADSDLHGHFSQ